MRILLILLLCLPMCGVGCGQSKPDPRDREDFVDTTDPSMVELPAPAGSGGGAPPPKK